MLTYRIGRFLSVDVGKHFWYCNWSRFLSACAEYILVFWWPRFLSAYVRSIFVFGHFGFLSAHVAHFCFLWFLRLKFGAIEKISDSKWLAASVHDILVQKIHWKNCHFSATHFTIYHLLVTSRIIPLGWHHIWRFPPKNPQHLSLKLLSWSSHRNAVASPGVACLWASCSSTTSDIHYWLAMDQEPEYRATWFLLEEKVINKC